MEQPKLFLKDEDESRLIPQHLLKAAEADKEQTRPNCD
jgi:hypothetical protein